MDELLREISTVVPPEADGMRLNLYVRRHMGVSYSQYAALKYLNCIFVNGEAKHADHRVATGDRVTVRLPERSRGNVPAESGENVIVYEDGDMFIVDKPAPMPCVYSGHDSKGTLENRLASVYGGDFVFRPLSRLDKGTSGLLAAAKHAHAYQLMQKTLHTDDCVREYLAVAEGEIDRPVRLTFPIGKIENGVKRFVDFENGLESVTDMVPLSVRDGRTLLRLRLSTGRTHQIRVHLSYIGHPVAGDYMYGTEDALRLPGRFALHSFRLRIRQPLTGEMIERVSIPHELLGMFGFDERDVTTDD